MSSPSGEPESLRSRHRWTLLALCAGISVIAGGCKPAEKSVNLATGEPPPISEAEAELIAQLAAARVDQARVLMDQKRPGEALALLVAAIKGHPASTEARSLAETILAETVWNFPILEIDHQLPIEQVHFTAPESLWVSLGGKANTTVRWNLDAREIASVLFPSDGVPTRSLVFGPHAKAVVIERGPVTLLCDATTLKPIRDLGPLPDFVTPTATVVFSADELLLAHPAIATGGSLVWHLRDVATGEILRTSDPSPADVSPPLAASLDRQKLRVLSADGSLMEMPVSPVEPVRMIPMPEPVSLLGAQFSQDGNSVLALVAQGHQQPPVQSIIGYGSHEDGSLELEALINRFPWSRHPNIWSGVMGDAATAPFLVEGRTLEILTATHAPVETDSTITAVAFGGSDVITGEESGMLTRHRFLPLPDRTQAVDKAGIPGPDALVSLENLSALLTGIRYDGKKRAFIHLDATARMDLLEDRDFTTIQEVFPALDFSGVRNQFAGMRPESATPEAFLPLWDRLARSDLTGDSWPAVLKLSRGLADTVWHRQLTRAVRGGTTAADADSPWLATDRMEELFRSGDEESVLAAISEAGNQGPFAAAALALALESDHPEWIEACLKSATDLPPVLLQIGRSRAAWLKGQRSTALSPWPGSFPEMRDIRRREDWEGWEQADFEPALKNIRQCVLDELVAIEVPESSTAEQRLAIADRLADPETLATVGKPRFALACMNAALAFSAHKEDSETTFELANTARSLGAPPEPCMRAEALALTAMGDYEKAHPLWITLITEHPLETQIPGDYAEAAYTAFENSDPQQAMTILTTGMHRYPEDANFALRAGWVALLTGNPERGYQFLKDGKRTGFPPEKEENAIALLTIAAAQCGFYDDATVYFNDLLRIDPAWGELATLDTLEWPEELKFSLSQFMQ